MTRLKILSRWQSLREAFNRTGDVKNLAEGAGDIRANLLDEAEQLMDRDGTICALSALC